MRGIGCISLLLTAALAGCGEGPALPIDVPGPPRDTCPPVLEPALGLGCIRDRYTSELAVQGDWAYTGTWGGLTRNGRPGNVLYVWNLGGAAPVLRDSIVVSGAETIGDVQVSDDGRLLVVATEYQPGSIIVYELADPARPRQLSRFASETTRAGVHTAKLARVDGRLYAFLSANPTPPRLVVVDLTDPAEPREVYAQAMGLPFIHDVFIRDGLLFTALWNAGLAIWDIGGGGRGGSPTAPVWVSSLNTVGGKVHNLHWLHDPASGERRFLLVGEEGPGSGAFGSSSSGDIHVVDLADLANPREVAFFRVPGAGTHNFSVDEARGILYAAYYNGGVRVLDVRGDLGGCTAAQRAADGRCSLGLMGRERRGFTQAGVFVWGVQWVGLHVYASDMLNGLWKLDAEGLRQ
jgi:hypothetical protein